MSAAEFRRRAELCRNAASQCVNVRIAAVWMHHHDRLITEALRAERDDQRFKP